MTETRKLAAILVADVLANLVRLEEAQSEAKAGLARPGLLDPPLQQRGPGRRAPSRLHAQGGSAGRISQARKLAAILLAFARAEWVQ